MLTHRNLRLAMTAALVSTAMFAGASSLAADDGSRPRSPGDCDYGGPMGYGMGYGMGPGMMHGGGGYGMGPGMMQGGGGYGMGPGMMHGWGAYGATLFADLDLSDEQVAKINKIQDETRRAHWALMGTMMDQQAKLRDLTAARKADPAAIGNAYKELDALRQKMLESSNDARKRIEAVLTKQQMEKLRSSSRWNW